MIEFKKARKNYKPKFFTLFMAEKVRDRAHHEKLFKASMSPIRRKMVATIGIYGKTLDELKQELKEELKLSDFQFKFNLDWLMREGFVVEKEGKLVLTDDGIELLEAG